VSSVLVIIVIALWNAFMGNSTTPSTQQSVAVATDVPADSSVATDVPADSSVATDVPADSSVTTDTTPVDSAAQSTDATAVATKPKRKPTAVKPTVAKPAPATNGSLAADSGFDVKTDGFSFENYGNDTGISNLKANDMRRMFGDKVCTKINNNTCTLTSPARQWMKEINAAMDGGHCERYWP
jgi:cytoskeletal protein RodZ